MNRDISLYIKDILEAMEKAERFVSGMSYENFFLDDKTNFAVVRCIEIIGEAVKHIPEVIRGTYSEIPWRDIAGMRDKVSHFYFGVDFRKVWLVVKNDIPRLKPHISQVLEDLGKSAESE